MDWDDIRPGGRITPLMLRTLSECPFRYWIEYEQNFRMAGHRPKPWPPSLEDLLLILLDAYNAANFNGTFIEHARSVVSEWKDGLLKVRQAPSADEATETSLKIDSIGESALRIVQHYNSVHGSISHFLPSKDIEHFIPAWGDGVWGRASKWKFMARVDGYDKLQKIPLLRKFTTNPSREEVTAGLNYGHAWKWVPWLVSRVSGETITTVCFDVVRLKAPSVPDTVKCRKCKGEGCHDCRGTGVSGISKRACDTTKPIFLDSLARQTHLDLDEQVIDHSSQLKRLTARGNTFCYRLEIEVQPGDINQWLRDTLETLKMTDNMRRRQWWPRKQSDDCRACPYRRPCSEKGRGENLIAWFAKVNDSYPGKGR